MKVFYTVTDDKLNEKSMLIKSENAQEAARNYCCKTGFDFNNDNFGVKCNLIDDDEKISNFVFCHFPNDLIYVDKEIGKGEDVYNVKFESRFLISVDKEKFMKDENISKFSEQELQFAIWKFFKKCIMRELSKEINESTKIIESEVAKPELETTKKIILKKHIFDTNT